ncbi:MAG TPA: hypothetical protein VIM07_14325 [Chitinophagaceae bacterium]
MAEITASTKNTGKKYPDSYRDKNIMVDLTHCCPEFATQDLQPSMLVKSPD